MASRREPEAVELYWIPLGAGAQVVRLSGWVYEAMHSVVRRERRSALLHTALQVWSHDTRYVIESAPIPDDDGRARGVVAEGPVGTRFAGKYRLFRYEIRRWPEGRIPDLHATVSTVRVTEDPTLAAAVLDVVPSVPTPVWGRDELRTGDMWNSNSLTSWLLATAGVDARDVRPPVGGRAPGWAAGIEVARREAAAHGR
jgi:hypothetical protein